MKKLIPFVVLLVIAVIAFALLKTRPPASGNAIAVAKLLPEQVLAFAYVPDPAASIGRFQKTALWNIGHEPEVLAFMEKPISKIPPMDAETAGRLKTIGDLKPSQLFVAFAGATGGKPEMAAGFEFEGDPAKLKDLLQPLADELQKGEGTVVDSLDIGGAKVQHYKSKDGAEIFSTINGKSYRVASTRPLIDLLLGVSGQNTPRLSDSPAFKEINAHSPKSFESLLYLRPAQIAHMAPDSKPGKGSPFAKLDNVSAVLMATSFEGTKIRDTIRVQNVSAGPAGEKSPLITASLVPAQSVAYFSTLLELPKFEEIESAVQAGSGGMAGIDSLPPVLRDSKRWEEIRMALGTEAGGFVEWPEGAMQQPGILIAIPVRNQKVLSDLLKEVLPQTGARSEMVGDVEFYSLATSGGMVSVTPVVALAKDFLLFSKDREVVTSALERLRNPPKVDASKKDGLRDFLAGDGSGASMVVYVDDKALFERVYAVFKATAPMIAIFVPQVNDSMDIGKLPASETITKHLTPSVLYQKIDPLGSTLISEGPVPITHLVGLAGAGGAAFAIFQKMGGEHEPGAFPVPSVPPANDPADPALQSPSGGTVPDPGVPAEATPSDPTPQTTP